MRRLLLKTTGNTPMTSTNDRWAEQARALCRINHNGTPYICKYCQPIYEALRSAEKEGVRRGMERAAKLADEMDTIVTLDCPCGLSTSVPCSRRHIATAIREEAKKEE